MVQTEMLKKLRPRDPAQALRAALGKDWKEPGRHAEGHVFHGDFEARITSHDRIGEVTFRLPFPLAEPIHGLTLGSDASLFQLHHPVSTPVPDDRDAYGWTFRRTRLPDGLDLTAGIIENEIRIITLSDPDAVYPERPYKRAEPALTAAFDLELSAPVHVETRPEHGWCFGRPPAIGPERWPISPVHGAPLRHAFTLKLPGQYRTRGPDLVAISLFVDEMFDTPRAMPTAGGAWATDGSRDGRRFDMECRETPVVLFWLNEEEFGGTLGEPPVGSGGTDAQAPGWLTRPPIDYFGEHNLPAGALDRRRNDTTAPGAHALLQLLEAERPRSGWAVLPAREALDYGFPIRVSTREGDPNAGRPAREWKHQNILSGYVPAYTQEGTALDLERFAEFDAHLGGTMFPAQAYPDFSPFYLEFSEVFGGFSFGGGTAQLDLIEMRIEWAS